MNSIASTIASARTHAAHRPFGATNMVKAAPKPSDTSLFTICDDSPVKRVFASGKYNAIFALMKPGQALKVPASDAPRVSAALHKWAKVNRPGHGAKYTARYPGDNSKTPGQVWLLPKDAA